MVKCENIFLKIFYIKTNRALFTYSSKEMLFKIKFSFLLFKKNMFFLK